MIQSQIDFASKLSLLKNEAICLGLYRTGRMLEIAIQEIGWEIQGKSTPQWQKERQKETLDPNYNSK